jgi:hypothetical protein
MIISQINCWKFYTTDVGDKKYDESSTLFSHDERALRHHFVQITHVRSKLVYI